MAKDPAALMYIAKYLTATAEMDADTCGWYTKLILFQYDKGDLPNDVEKLASLCNVRFSEFNRFEQVFEQVFKHKFKQNSNGRLEQEFAKEILQKRESFKGERSKAGKISYLKTFYKKHFKYNEEAFVFLKNNLDLNKIETKNEQVFKQVIKQKLELYINVNVNKDIDKDIIPFEESEKLLKPNTITSEIKKFITDVCEFFAQTTPDLRNEASSWIFSQADFNEFKNQTEAYMEFKNQTGQQIHGWRSFSLNGKWKSEDWVMKNRTQNNRSDTPSSKKQNSNNVTIN